MTGEDDRGRVRTGQVWRRRRNGHLVTVTGVRDSQWGTVSWEARDRKRYQHATGAKFRDYFLQEFEQVEPAGEAAWVVRAGRPFGPEDLTE